MKKTTLNVRLLRRIQKQILKEPRQFEMVGWFETGAYLGRPVPNCGTTACIAGWAIALGLKLSPGEANAAPFGVYSTEANKHLGIDDGLGDLLYYTDGWPKKFKAAFYRSVTPLQRARVAARYIDHFIKTYQTKTP